MRLHARPERHLRQRVGDHRLHAELLLDHLGHAGNRGATAGQHDLVDSVELAAGVEELQQAADLLDQRLLERLEHFDLVAFRQPALALGQAGFLVAQARSEEHTSELQSLMRSSYAVLCLKKKNNDILLKMTHT